MRIILLILDFAHIYYSISAIKERLQKATKTKGAENPIYLIIFNQRYYSNDKNLILFKYILQNDMYNLKKYYSSESFSRLSLELVSIPSIISFLLESTASLNSLIP